MNPASSTSSSSSTKSTLFGSICLLCLKTKTCTSVKTDPEQHCRSRVACINYIVLISRYLKLDSELTNISHKSFHRISNEVVGDVANLSQLDFSEEVNKFVLCDSCLPRAESFCKAYRELEVIRLKLEDNVADTVALIEKSAAEEEGKVPGNRRVVKRVAKPASKQVKEEGPTEPSENMLVGFRSKLRTNCSRLKKVEVPKVCLKRHEKAEVLAQRKISRINNEVDTHRKDGNGGEAPRVIRVICAEDLDSQLDLDKLLANFSVASFNDDIKVVDLVSGGSNGKKSLSATKTGLLGPGPSSKDNLVVERRTTQLCQVDGCGKVFAKNMTGSAAMQTHLQCHDNLACRSCGANNFNPMGLAIHELNHSTNDQPFGFKCARCSNFSSVRSDYQEHFLNCHYNSTLDLLKCPTCKKGFSHAKAQKLQVHIKKCHPQEFADRTDCYECDICHVYFKKTDALWKHLTYDHRINNRAGSFRCNFCPDAFFSSRFLDMHLSFSCSRPEKLICPDSSCNMEFVSEWALKKHITAHGSNLQLPTCPIFQCKLKDRYSMKYHMMTHNGEQVKLVFPNGSAEGQPVIIPLDKATPIIDIPSTTTTAQTEQKIEQPSVSISRTPQGIQIITRASQQLPSTSTVDLFAPVPIITTVTGCSSVSSENASIGSIPTSTSEIHCPAAPTIKAEDIKPEDISQYFFLEESEDSQQLIDFGNGAQIEDSFTWFLPDGDGNQYMF